MSHILTHRTDTISWDFLGNCWFTHEDSGVSHTWLECIRCLSVSPYLCIMNYQCNPFSFCLFGVGLNDGLLNNCGVENLDTWTLDIDINTSLHSDDQKPVILSPDTSTLKDANKRQKVVISQHCVRPNANSTYAFPSLSFSVCTAQNANVEWLPNTRLIPPSSPLCKIRQDNSLRKAFYQHRPYLKLNALRFEGTGRRCDAAMVILCLLHLGLDPIRRRNAWSCRVDIVGVSWSLNVMSML